MRIPSRFILSAFIISISLNKPAFAIQLYTTLYQNLNGADVVTASVLGKHVDSLSTLYTFRVDERLGGSISDSDICVITFAGKNILVAEEEKFTVGGKYLLLLYRGSSVFKSDPVRHQVYLQSHAFHTIRSFPESQKDYSSALEATRELLKIRLLNDSSEKTTLFRNLLKSNNDYLIESAIKELSDLKDARSIPDLRRLSGSGSDEVRFHALTGLAVVNGKEEVPTYWKALRDTSYSVRQSALQYLIWSEAISEDTLIEIATNAKEVFPNRAIAMHQLMIEHSTRSIPLLEQLLVTESANWEIRRIVPHIIDSLKTFLRR